MNVVATADGRLIEVQGTGEQRSFERAELDRLLDLAQAGIAELAALQVRRPGRSAADGGGAARQEARQRPGAQRARALLAARRRSALRDITVPRSGIYPLTVPRSGIYPFTVPRSGTCSVGCRVLVVSIVMVASTRPLGILPVSLSFTSQRRPASIGSIVDSTPGTETLTFAISIAASPKFTTTRLRSCDAAPRSRAPKSAIAGVAESSGRTKPVTARRSSFCLG